MLTAVLQWVSGVLVVLVGLAADAAARRHREVEAFRRGAWLLAVTFGVAGAAHVTQATAALLAVLRGPGSAWWDWMSALNPPLNAARQVWLLAAFALLVRHAWQPERPLPRRGWVWAGVAAVVAGLAVTVWAGVAYVTALQGSAIAFNLLLLLAAGGAWVGAARHRSLDGATWTAVGVYSLHHGVAAGLLLMDWVFTVLGEDSRWTRPLRFLWAIAIYVGMLTLLHRYAGRGRWGREGPMGGRPDDPAWRVTVVDPLGWRDVSGPAR